MFTSSRLLLAVGLLLGSWSSLRAQKDSPVSTADPYQTELLQWRAEHEARFRSPTGWLALTGHFWLKAGDNRLGSDADCEVRLPADAAHQLSGIVSVNGARVSISIQAGGPLLADGKEVTQVELPIDSLVPESDCPIKLTIGQRIKLQLVRRAGRYAVRVRDSDSDLIKAFKGKSWFDVDPRYRISARYLPYDKPKAIKIVNVKGDEVETQFAGALEFQLQEQTYRLDVIEESPDSLFVIFKDRTNGQSTYGAGRFVDVSLPADKDGQVVLDFNKTYSPPCAWSPHTLCPVPPKQNQLPISIEAGEKNR